MEKYLTNDELERLLMENIFEFYEEEMGEDTKTIYKDFLCDTKEKLRNTLNDEQKKILEFLEYNMEIYGTAIIRDAFFFGYRCCVKRVLEDHCF
jgi:hypothetical protein